MAWYPGAEREQDKLHVEYFITNHILREYGPEKDAEDLRKFSMCCDWNLRHLPYEREMYELYYDVHTNERLPSLKKEANRLYQAAVQYFDAQDGVKQNRILKTLMNELYAHNLRTQYATVYSIRLRLRARVNPVYYTEIPSPLAATIKELGRTGSISQSVIRLLVWVEAARGALDLDMYFRKYDVAREGWTGTRESSLECSVLADYVQAHYIMPDQEKLGARLYYGLEDMKKALARHGLTPLCAQYISEMEPGAKSKKRKYCTKVSSKLRSSMEALILYRGSNVPSEMKDYYFEYLAKKNEGA